MKTKVAREEFQEALAAVATLTSGRTPQPILRCVKLVADGDRVELSGTDGEASLHVGLPALHVERPGTAVVVADRLLSIVRELADIELDIESEERYCIIRGQGSEFRIFVLNPADFPPIPRFEDAPDLVIAGAQLQRMVALTIYASARETSRYAINGVLWEKQGKRLFLVATDGRRLARAGGGVAESRSADFQIIVPAKALSVFERVCTNPAGSEDWRVEVRVMPNQVLLRSNGTVLSSILVEGHFPKYQDVIPKSSNRRARMIHDEFYAAIRRAALLTTEESRAVRLAFEREKLVITSRSPEQGEARIEMPIEYEGEPLEIGFNPAFLQDALKVIPHEEIFLEMQEPFRPGVLCGEDKADFLYVIMPVSLAP